MQNFEKSNFSNFFYYYIPKLNIAFIKDITKALVDFMFLALLEIQKQKHLFFSTKRQSICGAYSSGF